MKRVMRFELQSFFLGRDTSFVRLLHTSIATRISHGDEDFARANEWPSSMCNQHVIEHQEILFTPAKRDCLLPVSIANLFDHRSVNGRSIAVVRVVRQVLFLKKSQHRITHMGLKSRDVPKTDVVEPAQLPRVRMFCKRWPNLASSQMLAVYPFDFHFSRTTICVNSGPVL